MTTFKTYEPDNRKPKNNEEDRLQATCFDYWNKGFRKTSLLFSVPNGQERNYSEVAIMTATGLTAGVSDLILLIPGAKTHFLELKTAKGKQRDGQKTFEANVRRLGFEYVVIRSFEQFKQHLIALLGPPNDSKSNNQDDEVEGGEEARRPGCPEEGRQTRNRPEVQRANGRRNEEVPSGGRNRRSVQTKV